MTSARQFKSWRKSSRSNEERNCAEVAFSSDAVGVRDSKLGDASPILTFTPYQWRTFLSGALLRR